MLSSRVYLGADLSVRFSTLTDTSFIGVANLGTLIPISSDARVYLDLHLDLGVTASSEALFVFGGGVGVAVRLGDFPAGVFSLGMNAHGVLAQEQILYLLRPHLGFRVAF